MSGSVKRVVAILEALRVSGAGDAEGGMTSQEVVERSGLPASTGYRILTELQDLGLVHRTAQRKLQANFIFERRLTHPTLDPEQLAIACSELSRNLIAASEIVVLSGQNMLWHIVEQHSEQVIRLRAFPGFTRTSYELDSISRLALAHVPVPDLEKNWDMHAFYTAGVNREQLDPDGARDLIAAVDRKDMQFDMMGNSKGIRRFCMAIHDKAGALSCLLTVAEGAMPVRDEAAHVAEIRALLTEQKNRIEQNADLAVDTG
ncbi:DNA-binding IclR family transcriptional regulator [Aliiruegeria haliotis]|uniref:DNA-binding IclR family transcriptional regulator n=1 Tax=Aliiruegeria haliotis TaxID=1280846 RepID=A0A2T0RFM5_9RHOB|nr:helix-turn-helix domain-containing protein [Aliiruegeria haliotis]PRY19947.1 DNA-binding IclR family transcriptional regulator [Aliiruegeria haliotis]